VDLSGEFFNVHGRLPKRLTPPRTPILLSALRPRAFRQAGEIADGAISWVCPISYLAQTAKPALQSGAESAGREAPLLIAHVPVALTEDGDAARQAGRAFLSNYARLPFYAGMFREAGHPVPGDGSVSDALIDELVVWGDAAGVVQRLDAALAAGMDELLVTLLPVRPQEEHEQAFAAALDR
jgi:hypothetical protein